MRVRNFLATLGCRYKTMLLFLALVLLLCIRQSNVLWLLQGELVPQASRVFGAPAETVPREIPPPQASDSTLRWVVLGDWGTGGEVQRRVARAMAALTARAPVHFVLSTGDNIYPAGVRSADDPQWEQKFERPYAAPSLQGPWYPVLGNHDYRGNPEAQIAYSARSTRWRMPARFYRVLHLLPDSTPVLFIALDTQQLVSGSAEARRAQLQWLEGELAGFSGVWKFVWGHHPLRSAGAYGENQTLLRMLKPLFDRFGVAVYFCGHEHDLQLLHHPDDGFFCVVSGAGGGVRSTAYGRHTLFAAAEPGFVYAALEKQRLHLWFITADGLRRYHAVIPKPRVQP